MHHKIAKSGEMWYIIVSLISRYRWYYSRIDKIILLDTSELVFFHRVVCCEETHKVTEVVSQQINEKK